MIHTLKRQTFKDASRVKKPNDIGKQFRPISYLEMYEAMGKPVTLSSTTNKHNDEFAACFDTYNVTEIGGDHLLSVTSGVHWGNNRRTGITFYSGFTENNLSFVVGEFDYGPRRLHFTIDKASIDTLVSKLALQGAEKLKLFSKRKLTEHQWFALLWNCTNGKRQERSLTWPNVNHITKRHKWQDDMTWFDGLAIIMKTLNSAPALDQMRRRLHVFETFSRAYSEFVIDGDA